jgi:hypothetical protein
MVKLRIAPRDGFPNGRVAASCLAGLLLVFTTSCGTTRAGTAHLQDPETHLVELNRHLFEQLLLHHDPEPYRAVADPEYLFIANIGIVENLEEVTTNLDNLDIKALTVTNEEFRLRNSTAVLVGTMRIQGTVLGFALPAEMRYMSVFVRQGDEWRLLSRSLTEINDPRVGAGPEEQRPAGSGQP